MVLETKKMKKFLTSAAAAAMIATAFVPAVSADTVKTAAFTDVPASYKTSVNYLVDNKLAKGLTATKFGIDANIKRGDAAIILAEALDLMDSKAPKAGFTDVPKRGAVAINSLKAAGIINGKTKTRFGFDDKITRGEVALMMSGTNAYNFKGDTKELKFTDVGSRYSASVAGLMFNGITQGESTTQFGTEHPIKRGDFAVFTYRAEQLTVGGDALKEFRTAMNGFASIGAAIGFDVVVDATKENTFNIVGDPEAVAGGDGATGFFKELTDLGIETMEVNGKVYEISDEEGTVLVGAGEAKAAIMSSLLGDKTVDVTFYVPNQAAVIKAPYTFNLKLK